MTTNPAEAGPAGASRSVLVTRRLAPGVLDRLPGHVEVHLHDSDVPMAREELLRAVKGRDAVLTTLDDAVDDEFLDAAGPGLLIVANHAVGTHNIDLAACAARGVTVANTPGVLTDATADLAFALLLAAARRLGESERLVRAQRPWHWAPDFMLGLELPGSPLGILGLGRIGRAVAKRAQGFDMPVSYHSRNQVPDEAGLGVRWQPLDEMLAGSAAVVVCCPLTPETRGLLDARRLALLPPGAVVVSVTAGVVDEDALAEALAGGALGGAAIDNHTHEPVVNAGLLDQERAVLTPHIGTATLKTRRAMGSLALDNILAVLAGTTPPTPVA
jgi:glyoxylate reductase